MSCNEDCRCHLCRELSHGLPIDGVITFSNHTISSSLSLASTIAAVATNSSRKIKIRQREVDSNFILCEKNDGIYKSIVLVPGPVANERYFDFLYIRFGLTE